LKSFGHKRDHSVTTQTLFFQFFEYSRFRN
jgi:hypothetical protein